MSDNVRHQCQQTSLSTAGNSSILSSAMLVADRRRMPMASTRLGRNITCHEQSSGVSNRIIVTIGNCTRRSCTMRNEHRDRQSCDDTRKLLPD